MCSTWSDAWAFRKWVSSPILSPKSETRMNELLDPPEKTVPKPESPRPNPAVPRPPAKPAASKPATRRVVDEEDEDLFARHRKKLIAAVVLVLAGLAVVLAFKDN